MFHLFPFRVFWEGIFLMIKRKIYSVFLSLTKNFNYEFRTNSQL